MDTAVASRQARAPAPEDRRRPSGQVTRRPGAVEADEVHEISVLDYHRLALVIDDDELTLSPAEFSLLSVLVSRLLGLALDKTYRATLRAAGGPCSVCSAPGHDFVNYATEGLAAEFLAHYKYSMINVTRNRDYLEGETWYVPKEEDVGAIVQMRKTLRQGIPQPWFDQRKCRLRRKIYSKGPAWSKYQITGTTGWGRTCIGVDAYWKRVTIRGGPFQATSERLES